MSERAEYRDFNPAVRATKRPRVSDGQPWQDDELFPTPPWATRALLQIVLPRLFVGGLGQIWEPCAGLGHMAEVLAEGRSGVFATDKNLYQLDDGRAAAEFGIVQQDFLAATPAHWPAALGRRPARIISNPPFSLAAQMVRHALSLASDGVAMLLRMQWLETLERYQLFAECPPTIVAVFTERVAMCEGGWDPKLSSASGYAWFCWERNRDGWIRPARAFEGAFDGMLIPPCKKALSRPEDLRLAARFVPGFVPPSTLKKTGKAQRRMEFA